MNISSNAQELPSRKLVTIGMAGEVTENDTEDRSRFIYCRCTTVSDGIQSTQQAID